MLKLNKDEFILKTFNEKYDLNGDYEIYPCGSRHYGTNHCDSDHDYIIINKKIDERVKVDSMHLIFIKEERWRLALNTHQIFELDVMYTNKNCLEKYSQIFRLDIDKLYHSVLQTFDEELGRSLSYLMIGNEYAAKKNMIYAWRAIYLGAYLSQHPTLDYGPHLKKFWQDIMSCQNLRNCKKKCLDYLDEYKLLYKKITCGL